MCSCRERSSWWTSNIKHPTVSSFHQTGRSVCSPVVLTSGSPSLLFLCLPVLLNLLRRDLQRLFVYFRQRLLQLRLGLLPQGQLRDRRPRGLGGGVRRRLRPGHIFERRGAGDRRGDGFEIFGFLGCRRWGRRWFADPGLGAKGESRLGVASTAASGGHLGGTIVRLWDCLNSGRLKRQDKTVRGHSEHGKSKVCEEGQVEKGRSGSAVGRDDIVVSCCLWQPHHSSLLSPLLLHTR